jgi:hypothetical protein
MTKERESDSLMNKNDSLKIGQIQWNREQTEMSMRFREKKMTPDSDAAPST